MDENQLDKQTPKTFKEWSQSKDNPVNTIPAYFYCTAERVLFVQERSWDAATEATRAKYDDKIKAMQAEIDKRDAVILDVKNTLIVIDNLRGKHCIVFKGCHCFADTAHFKLKELNQRGEDE